ncbi:MAG: 2-dehydro-3-deoxygalactonokinase [Balneolaceae bacterium]
MTTTHFLGCDWGTSSFRLHLVDASTGESLCHIQDSDGIQAVRLRLTKTRPAEERSRWMRSLLREKTELLARRSNMDIDGLPILVSGMASSSIGLCELPYARLPLSLEKPNLVTRIFTPSEILPHTILLISGISGEDDVMRGEEIQVLGLSDQYSLDQSICILPGTHSKHLYIKDGNLVNFRSFLTGELFDLLQSHSILSESVDAIDFGSPDSVSSFRKGVEESGSNSLLHSLFTIRARHLLKGSSPQNNYFRLSGLLIGTEVRELKSDVPIVLAGSGSLTKLYSEALNEMGIDHETETGTDRLTLLGQRKCLPLLNIDSSLI